MIYSSSTVTLPDVDILTLLFGESLCRSASVELAPHAANAGRASDTKHAKSSEETPLHAEARDPSRIITKRQTRELSKSFACFLRENYGIGASGPGKDVVVGFFLGQSAIASFFYGVVAAGGVYSAASPAATASELARQIQDGSARALACSRELRPVALKAAIEAGLPESSVIVLESYPEIKLCSSDGARVCDFEKILDWPSITDPKILSSQTACLVYSSGTTGLPKGRHTCSNSVEPVMLKVT